jgi:anaphase-promoting complex subunit 10
LSWLGVALYYRVIQPASYWQSDGTAPHLINIQFARKTSVKQLSLYLDHSLDESYTPKKFCIRAGSTNHDLRDVAIVNLHEPQGWINIPLGDPTALGDNRCGFATNLL